VRRRVLFVGADDDRSRLDVDVLLDVPAPRAGIDPADAPAWDDKDNPEHVDFIKEFEDRFARERRPIDAPLSVVTASKGQSDQKDQSSWLGLSPDPDAVLLEGGHVIYEDDPHGCAEVIRAMIEKVRG
jgi:hypothetical protein